MGRHTFTVERAPKGGSFSPLKDVVGLSYAPRTLDFSIPRFELRMDNTGGRWSTFFKRSDEVKIYRNGILEFHGLVLDVDKAKHDQHVLVVSGSHIQYSKVKQMLATNAVKSFGYNPWKIGRMTKADETTVVHGLSPDDLVKAAIGTRFTMQHFFRDGNILAAATNTQLLEGGMMLTPDGANTFLGSGTFRTKALRNAAEGLSTMKTIRGGTLTAVGDQPANTVLKAKLSRDGGANYGTLLTGTFDGATGAWTFNVAEGYWPAGSPDNILVVEFQLEQTGGFTTATPTVLFFAVDFETTDGNGLGDTGLSEGTIEAFAPPTGGHEEVGGEWNQQPRVKILEDVVKASPSPDAEEYPTWFGYIDNDGKVHFRDPVGFGNDWTGTPIRFDNEKARAINVRKDGNIINNLIHIGHGIPNFGQLITNLKDNDSITEFGEVQGTFLDKGMPSVSYALNRASVVLKQVKSPITVVEAELDPEFHTPYAVGDKLRIEDPHLAVSEDVRVLELEWRWSADDEGGKTELSITLSNKLLKLKGLMNRIADLVEDQSLVGQGYAAPPSMAFNDNVDKDAPADLNFWIPPDKSIRSIRLFCRGSQFRSYVKNTASESAHTHGVTGESTGDGGSHSHSLIDDGLHSHSASPNENNPKHTHVITGDTEFITSPLARDVSKTHSNYTAPANLAYPAHDEKTFTGINVDDVEYVVVKVSLTGANGLDISWKLGFEDSAADGGFLLRDWASSLDDAAVVIRNYMFPGTMLGFLVGFGSTLDRLIYTFANTSGSAENIDLTFQIQVYEKHRHAKGTLGENTSDHTHTVSISSQGTHNHGGASQQADHQHTITGVATDPGSSHTHGQDYGIFKESVFPTVQMFVRDHPTVGTNPDEGNLTVRYVPFGKRGSDGAGFDVEGLDVSDAFRDSNGNFRTGLQRLYFDTEATGGNAKGLGRISAAVFIELEEVREDNKKGST